MRGKSEPGELSLQLASKYKATVQAALIISEHLSVDRDTSEIQSHGSRRRESTTNNDRFNWNWFECLDGGCDTPQRSTSGSGRS